MSSSHGRRRRFIRAGLWSAISYAVAGNDPKTVADFEAEYYRTGGSDTTFASMFSFARASNATYVDSAGVLQTASSGVARVGHHRFEGGQWVNKGLLLETEARTNLLILSEDFANAGWTKTNSSISTDAVSSPNGQADKIVEDTATGRHGISESLTAPGSDSTVQVLAKAAERSWLIIRADAADTFFNLGTGAVGTVNGSHYNAGIEDWGDGWYLCSLTATASAFIGIYATTGNGTTSYAGDGSSGIYVGFAQYENALTHSSYILTTGAEATRAAEVLRVPAANMAYSTTAMSFQMDGEMRYVDEADANQVIFYRVNIDSANRIRCRLRTDGTKTGQVDVLQAESGTTDAVSGPDDTYAPGRNVSFNIASRNTSGAVNGAADGTAFTADTTPTALPDFSATDFDLGNDFMGTIAKFRQWDVDLGDAGIEEASA